MLMVIIHSDLDTHARVHNITSLAQFKSFLADVDPDDRWREVLFPITGYSDTTEKIDFKVLWVCQACSGSNNCVPNRPQTGSMATKSNANHRSTRQKPAERQVVPVEVTEKTQSNTQNSTTPRLQCCTIL
eukprot:m.57258 g.57258  ORF g.57258 m.57258 type:complete len:130 (-) comp7741_c0_seq2:2-391(-)